MLHSYEMVGVELVYLDPKTITPLRIAMPGICFRVPLGNEDLKSGLLNIQPKLIPFLIDRFNCVIAQSGIEVRDENDQIISNGLVTIPYQTITMWGKEVTRDLYALDLRVGA